MIWYYIDETITEGERRKGPFNIDEIRDFVKQGTIKDETLVWHTGMEAWVEWKDTEESKEIPLSEEDEIRKALETIIAEHNKGKRYAGFFVRGAAYFIDNFILSVAGVLIIMVMSAMQLVDLSAVESAMNIYINDPTSDKALMDVLNIPGMHTFLVIWGIAQAIYFVLFTKLKAATPGKLLMKVHVETSQGENLSWFESLARFLASLFTQITLMFYGLGYLIVMVDPKRRALHDWIAHTRVVHDKIRREPKEGKQKN